MLVKLCVQVRSRVSAARLSIPALDPCVVGRNLKVVAMYTLLLNTLILTNLFFFGSLLPKQESSKPKAILVHRFEKKTDQYPISQAVYASLKDYPKDPNNVIALRVCSNDKFPLALYASAANPVIVQGYIQSGWMNPIPYERIPFLRSEDCLSENSSIVPVEVWVVPKGASLPPYVESVRFCQLRFGYVATNKLEGRPYLVSQREYQVALRKLVAKLRRNPKAVALFWGQYIREPSPILEKSLRDILGFMNQYGFERNRYYAELDHYGGDYWESTPEPQYPDILTVEISEKCRKLR